MKTKYFMNSDFGKVLEEMTSFVKEIGWGKVLKILQSESCAYNSRGYAEDARPFHDDPGVLVYNFTLTVLYEGE